MNRHQAIVSGVVTGLIVAAVPVIMLARAPDPEPTHRDATLMRPGLRVDTSDKKIRIHGNWTVLRPVGSGRDHAVSVRLTVIRPDDEKELYSEELAKIDYRRDHPRGRAYPINKEMNFDAAGLDVKVAAVDVADGREFASVTVHGTPAHPSPGPREGE